jgi:hypothetical protein
MLIKVRTSRSYPNVFKVWFSSIEQLQSFPKSSTICAGVFAMIAERNLFLQWIPLRMYFLHVVLSAVPRLLYLAFSCLLRQQMRESLPIFNPNSQDGVLITTRKSNRPFTLTLSKQSTFQLRFIVSSSAPMADIWPHVSKRVAKRTSMTWKSDLICGELLYFLSNSNVLL